MNQVTQIQPEPIVNASDIADAFQATALLVDMSISVWSGERSDTGLMDKIKADAGAVGNVGRTIKNLLAGADDPLKAVRAAFAQVRAVHYEITLPWVSDPHATRQTGPRLLPTALFEKYLTDTALRRREAMAALDTFVTAYPGLVARARVNLAALADADYPDADTVRAAFRINTDFTPVPSGAAFRGLPKAWLERLSTGLQRKQDRMIAEANAAMWSEVKDRVKHIVDRMADPAAKFHATTVEHLRDLIVLLPGWNIEKDARAAEIVDDISRMLSGVDAKAIRANVSVRADIADQAAAVASKLSAWGV